MFSNISLQQRAPHDLTFRAAQKLPDTVIHSLNADFDTLYSYSGRSRMALSGASYP
jgi:hypothetical protein